MKMVKYLILFFGFNISCICQSNIVLEQIENALFPWNSYEEMNYFYGYSELLNSKGIKVPIIARKNLPNDSILNLFLAELKKYPINEYIKEYDSLVLKCEQLIEKEFGHELKYNSDILFTTRIIFVYKSLLDFGFERILNELKLDSEYLYNFIKYCNLKFTCNANNYHFDSIGRYSFVFEKINSLKMFQSIFAKKFIASYFNFESIYFDNEKILVPFFIKDLETIKVIRFEDRCNLSKSDSGVFRPLFYTLVDYYESNPNDKITDIFISKYFNLSDNNLGVARYLGMHGDKRCYPILDSVFEGKYNCLWKNCLKETFQAFTSSIHGRNLGFDFLQLQLENQSLDSKSKIKYIDYFNFVDPIEAVNYLKNYKKKAKSKKFANKIDLKLIELNRSRYHLYIKK